MPAILATGTYSETNAAALDQMGALRVDTLDDISGLDAPTRDGVKALAFSGHTAMTGAFMDLLPNLGLIANFGVGYDTIDVVEATKRGIRVTNTPDVLTGDVADLAIALLLGAAREVVPATDWIRAGNWSSVGSFRLARRFYGGRIGIVGLGRIGRAIADRLVGFDMDIHYTSRSKKETPGWTYHDNATSLAEAVDFLVVALVGGPETEGHVSAEVISALGPEGILVNISRGTTVDEGALLDALENGTIAGAGLDVFENEPHLDERFLKLENVMLQPHQASATHDTRNAMGQLQRDNVSAYLSGNPLITPVN